VSLKEKRKENGVMEVSLSSSLLFLSILLSLSEDNLLLDALALLKEKGKEEETFAFERLPWKSVAKFVPNRSGLIRPLISILLSY
jgi:hypothetical protein